MRRTFGIAALVAGIVLITATAEAPARQLTCQEKLANALDTIDQLKDNIDALRDFYAVGENDGDGLLEATWGPKVMNISGVTAFQVIQANGKATANIVIVGAGKIINGQNIEQIENITIAIDLKGTK